MCLKVVHYRIAEQRREPRRENAEMQKCKMKKCRTILYLHLKTIKIILQERLKLRLFAIDFSNAAL